MSKEDNWADKFRNRMAEYREPVPENLWTELEKELKRPKNVIIYLRYAAIVTIVVLSSAVLWWIWRTNSMPETICRLPGYPPNGMSNPESSLENEKDVIVKQKIDDRRLMANSNTEKTEYVSFMTSVPEEETLPKKDGSVIEKTGKGKEQLYGNNNSNRKFVPAVKRSFHNVSSVNYHNFAGKEKKRNWEVSVAVGNMPDVSKQEAGYTTLQGRRFTMLSSIAESGKSSAEQMASIVGAYSQLVANNIDKEVQSKAKHKMPITTGITVRKYLTDRWAVESGIIYTQLSSRLWSGTENNYYKTEQKLHYVGVPLKGIYCLWKNNLFSVYASVGGAVEKCVSGKQNTVCTIDGTDKGVEKSDVDADELQWSVSSAVGAQVRLFKNLGVYLEPGVNYYFKDGNDIQTVRKEHPLNFNMQIGVRFSF